MKKILLAILALAAVSAAQAKPKTYDLRYDLAPGRSLMNNANIEVEITMADTATMNVGMLMETEYKVRARRDSVYDLDVTFSRMRTAAQTPMGEMVADSDSAEGDDIMTRLMKMMTGKTFGVVMSDRGRTIEVDGLDKLFDLGDTPPADIPERVWAQMKEQLKAQLGGGKLAEVMENNMMLYPDHPVAVGDEWTGSQVSDISGMNISADMRCRLAGVKGGRYMVEVAADMSVPGGGTTMTGTMAGTMVIDRKTGWIDSATMTSTFESQNPGMPMRMKMTITITD